MDPFQAPGAEATNPVGTLDLGRAVVDGGQAVLSNLGSTLGALVLGVVLYYASICTCVGWIGVAPLLLWGMYRFVLDAVDGPATVGALFSGTRRFGDVFLRMWGLILVWLLLFSPVVVAVSAWLVPKLLSGQAPDPIEQSLVIGVPSTLYGLLVARFLVAPFLMVDRDLPLGEAFAATWELTRGHGLKLAGLQLLLALLNAPAQVLSVGAQIYGQDAPPDPFEALDRLSVVMALNVGVIGISLLAGMFGLAFFAAAYRQLAGPAPTPGA